FVFLAYVCVIVYSSHQYRCNWQAGFTNSLPTPLIWLTCDAIKCVLCILVLVQLLYSCFFCAVNTGSFLDSDLEE
ncbi:hypothetical protein Ocin01_01978, partial [Orchesella cincta]